MIGAGPSEGSSRRRSSGLPVYKQLAHPDMQAFIDAQLFAARLTPIAHGSPLRLDGVNVVDCGTSPRLLSPARADVIAISTCNGIVMRSTQDVLNKFRRKNAVIPVMHWLTPEQDSFGIEVRPACRCDRRSAQARRYCLMDSGASAKVARVAIP
jgi:hypothetical protein